MMYFFKLYLNGLISKRFNIITKQEWQMKKKKETWFFQKWCISLIYSYESMYLYIKKSTYKMKKRKETIESVNLS